MWKLGGNEQRHPLITSTTLVTLPLHGSQLLICRVRTPAYIAAGHHIWWSFPYPPHGDAVGSLQLGPNKTESTYIINSLMASQCLNREIRHDLMGNVKQESKIDTFNITYFTRSSATAHFVGGNLVDHCQMV